MRENAKLLDGMVVGVVVFEEVVVQYGAVLVRFFNAKLEETLLNVTQVSPKQCRAVSCSMVTGWSASSCCPGPAVQARLPKGTMSSYVITSLLSNDQLRNHIAIVLI